MSEPTLIVPPFLEPSLNYLREWGMDFSYGCASGLLPCVQGANRSTLPKDYGIQWVRNTLGQVDATLVPTVAMWSGIACGRRLLPVPTAEDEIKQVLDRLEGRQHQLVTVIGLRKGDRLYLKDWVSRVKFKRLSLQERQSFIGAPSLWQGRLGGYVGNFSLLKFLTHVNGTPGFMLGFPCYEVYNFLKGHGL